MPMPLRLAALRPLRHRDFALLWSAAFLSNTGSWMQSVAVGVLVTARTGQARWTGLVAAAAFLPMGLLSPLGGAVADRLDRRRWLLLTTLGETAIAAVLAALAATGKDSPAVVTIVVLGGGAMTAIGFPAYQAMLPDLVEDHELLGAVSLSSAQFNLGRVVGPALAGLVLVVGSYALAFAVNAASFSAVILALLVVRPRPALSSPEAGGIRRRLVSGARTAWGEPGCRTAIGLIATVALLASPFIALVPAVALRFFHDEASGTAVLVTCQGVGAVAGALALAPLAGRFGRRQVLVASLLSLPLLLLLYAMTPVLALGALAIFGVGAAYIGVLSGLNTVVQLRAPPAARARVLGLFMMALGTIYPLAAIAQGAVADRIGLRETTAGAAAAFLLLFATFAARRADLVAALDDPARSPSSARA
jgi:MFS family permease